MKEDSAKVPLPVFFLAGGHKKLFWHGQGQPLFGTVNSAFPPPTTVLSNLKGAMKDGFGET